MIFGIDSPFVFVRGYLLIHTLWVIPPTQIPLSLWLCMLTIGFVRSTRNQGTEMTKPVAKTVKPAAKKAAPAAKPAQAPKVKLADPETLKLVDQQKEMMGKSAGKPVMPKVKPPVAEPAVQSKADIARALFKKMNGKNTRQEILKAFQEQAKLTPAGSATYLANFKKELVGP
jgi:hypothetical protein